MDTLLLLRVPLGCVVVWATITATYAQTNGEGSDNLDPLPSGDVAYLSVSSYTIDPSVVERNTDVMSHVWYFTGVYLSYSMNRTIANTSLTHVEDGCNWMNMSEDVRQAIKDSIVVLPETNCSMANVMTNVQKSEGSGIIVMSSVSTTTLAAQAKSVWYPTYTSTNSFHMVLVSIARNTSSNLTAILLSNDVVKVSISPTAPNSTSYTNENVDNGDNSLLQWTIVAGSFFAGLAIIAIVVATVMHLRRRYLRNHYFAHLAQREQGPLRASLTGDDELHEHSSAAGETSLHCQRLQRQRARALLATLRKLVYVQPSPHSVGFAKEIGSAGSNVHVNSGNGAPGPPLTAWEESTSCSSVVQERTMPRRPRGDVTALDNPFTAVDQPNCVICLSAFGDGDRLMELPCLHLYHDACVTPWLDEHRECPLCKRDVYALQFSTLMATPSATGGRAHGMVFDGEDTFNDNSADSNISIPGRVHVVGDTHAANPVPSVAVPHQRSTMPPYQHSTIHMESGASGTVQNFSFV